MLEGIGISIPSQDPTLPSGECDGRKGIFPPGSATVVFCSLLLIPCFWQSRIQSADLSSHAYNAWLASQVHRGQLPGLSVSSQSNNVLFDLVLEWLLVRVGPDWGQRLAVSLSVFLFGFGAILFIFRVAGRNWWFAGPCVAMLAYGFIFHIGFFNFYLSIGICLLYLAIFWDNCWRIRAAAAPLLILAWTAHPFPVAWAVGTAVYIALAKSVKPQQRLVLLGVATTCIAVARYILTHQYAYNWSAKQFLFVTSANQLSLSSGDMIPFATLLFVWLSLSRKLVKSLGITQLLQRIPLQLWILNAAGVALIPDRLMLPQFARPFAFITGRLSLGAALMICAALATVPLSRLEKITLLAGAALFFGFVFTDDIELNRLEDRVDLAVASLPPMQRVVMPLLSPSLHSLCVQHDLDRACIGHCFSYANYEPSSLQFRIRARPHNGIVLDNYADVNAVASGSYIVRPHDVPLYLVYLCGIDLRDVCTRPLQIGENIRQVISETIGK
jgi:hypothetical protein